MNDSFFQTKFRTSRLINLFHGITSTKLTVFWLLRISHAFVFFWHFEKSTTNVVVGSKCLTTIFASLKTMEYQLSLGKIMFIFLRSHFTSVRVLDFET